MPPWFGTGTDSNDSATPTKKTPHLSCKSVDTKYDLDSHTWMHARVTVEKCQGPGDSLPNTPASSTAQTPAQITQHQHILLWAEGKEQRSATAKPRYSVREILTPYKS